MTSTGARMPVSNRPGGQEEHAGSDPAGWKQLYQVGAAAALLIVLIGLIEVGITFLPGGERVAPDSMTVSDWFELYQTNAFLGLRNLGLLNILIMILGLPFFGALYGALRHTHQAWAGLALIVFCVGVAVFLANNAAFSMLALSEQYARAADEVQRAQLLASGQTLLAIGESHTPGSFLGFFLTEAAGLIMSWVMLRDRRFGKAAAIAGLLGFVLMGLFDISSAFIPALFDVAMILVMGGGLLSMVWYVLGSRRLFQLGREAR